MELKEISIRLCIVRALAVCGGGKMEKAVVPPARPRVLGSGSIGVKNLKKTTMDRNKKSWRVGRYLATYPGRLRKEMGLK